MNPSTLPPDVVDELKHQFEGRVAEEADLAPFTSARIGGPAELLLEVRSRADLVRAFQYLWRSNMPAMVLGGGSNVLVSDRGVRGVVVLNKARAVRFDDTGPDPVAWAESGAVLGNVARRTVARGWSGLEWAATVPGTVGGAVYGNAGAHGSDTAACLDVAEILQREVGESSWSAEDLEYGYRTSRLKRNPGQAVVLAAAFSLERSTVDAARGKMQEFIAHRRATQPGGASWGSMFKNPAGDYAGRLIEAAGLKGLRQGDAEVSTQHANFFINHGRATAADVRELLRVVRQRVQEHSGVALELEIQLLGDWDGEQIQPRQP